MNKIKRVTLEISLKPFKTVDLKRIDEICVCAFEQWKKLIDTADEVGIMLWTGDGSELLEYRGNLSDRFEWARFIGGANVKMEWDRANDPEGKGLHTRCYDYMEDPPQFTYADLKNIVLAFKKAGKQITDKPIYVGTTFDPGPEFAISDFKYNRHNEICEGGSMGKKSMVCCYYSLNEDDVSYAAYPDGIPQDTPFGTFLGKQAQIFMSDMGFDFIWFSNGLGFGTETWGVSGALFDGKQFFPEKIAFTRSKISEFWSLFTKECSFPVQTRGTNLTAGIDFASDGVDHQHIYNNNPTLLPPPNSPWAALDGNFGLELAGYMSRMAHLPGSDFLFRFYVHDIWWLNSPWIDRYEGQPHDIYLPCSTARIDENGNTVVANHINLLSIDNSYGEMPERCPNEAIPHIISSYDNAPDAPSPLIWVYPFSEYSDMACGRLEKSFYEDWFFIAALNHGLPVNTVVSTANFKQLLCKKPDVFKGRVLVTPIPEKGSSVCDSLEEFIKSGGFVMFYGSLKGTDESILKLLNLKQTNELCGEMTLTDNTDIQREIENGDISYSVSYGGIFTDGGLDGVIDDESSNTEVLAYASQGNNKRVIAICNPYGQAGGAALWCRGCDCSRKPVDDNDAAKTDDTAHYDSFPVEILMRRLLSKTGYKFGFKKYDKFSAEPIILMHRCRGSLWFDGCCADTTVELTLKTPIGAPLLLANETRLCSDGAIYHMPRAWRHECRVFIEGQESGIVHAKETIPTAYGIDRRILVEGLDNATVYVIPKDGDPDKTFFLLNSNYPHFVSEPFDCELVDSVFGAVYKIKNITGKLLISDKL